jgi:imidazole glycerol phosphate synthase glutamine amidotransferase subunit
MKKIVTLISYGTSNINSLAKKIYNNGFEVKIASKPKDLCGASKIIIPGIGNFSAVMKALVSSGMDEGLREKIAGEKVPTLGICLGMQLLFEGSEEGAGKEACFGLGVVPGVIKRIDFSKTVPHIGWKRVLFSKDSILAQGIDPKKRFYFTHSYFADEDCKFAIGTTVYEKKFTSVIECENIYGVQFHPEKSGLTGFEMIKNFIKKRE